LHRAAAFLGFWSAFLAIYDVLQKQASQFIDWAVAQDFCGRQRSIRTEEECSGIWRLTRLRLSLVKLHQISQRQHPHSILGLEIKVHQARARRTRLSLSTKQIDNRRRRSNQQRLVKSPSPSSFFCAERLWQPS